MNTPKKTTSTALVPRDPRMLSAEQFHQLAEISAVIEWLRHLLSALVRPPPRPVFGE
jgi:hypothetical protein